MAAQEQEQAKVRERGLFALGAAAYGLSLVALLALPETRGRRLAVD
jgi:hypothetical protein